MRLHFYSNNCRKGIVACLLFFERLNSETCWTVGWIVLPLDEEAKSWNFEFDHIMLWHVVDWSAIYCMCNAYVCFRATLSLQGSSIHFVDANYFLCDRRQKMILWNLWEPKLAMPLKTENFIAVITVKIPCPFNTKFGERVRYATCWCSNSQE